MRHRGIIPAAALVAILLAASVIVMTGGAAASGAKPSGDYVQGEVIVKFKDAFSVAAKARLLSSDALAVVHENADLGFQVVKLPAGASVPDTVARFAADPSVEYAEPNYIDHVSMTPNDPQFTNQWNMQDYTMGGIDAQHAWDLEQGDPSVVVAVVDTGVAYENYGSYAQAPDLAGTNFVLPHDSADGDGHPNDVDGHGTHVTGTIAQTTNNGIGCAGVAHGCSVMPVRCLGPGAGTHAMMADAFTWAADNGAKVINYSGGGLDSTTKRDACKYAYEHGVTICASSGNDSSSTIQYPAAYDEYCIAVGATDRNKNQAYYSNYGAQQDVVAPGGDTTSSEFNGVIQQTYVTEGSPSSGFALHGWMGTSMACPHVAATAALFISKTGISDPDKVRDQLQRTAHDLGTVGRDDSFGYGLIDAYAALTVPFLDALSPASRGVGMGDFTLTVDGANFTATSVVRWNGADRDTTYVSDKQLTAQVLASDVEDVGTADVTVFDSVSSGTSEPRTFNINPKPAISSISPNSGCCGDTITVNGSNFGSTRGTSYVSFGTKKDTSYTSWTSTQIKVKVPSGCYWTRDVKVTTADGTSNTKTFKVKPHIKAISPTSGKVGAYITIGGTGFGSSKSTSSVKFGTKLAYTSSTSWTDVKVKAKVPILSKGKTTITVTTRGGTSNSYTFTVK